MFLSKFHALNEQSITSDSTVTVTKEDSDDDGKLLALYNEALSLYATSSKEQAESKFELLLASDYLEKRGFKSKTPKETITRIQYNALRFLGFCKADRGDYQEALNALEEALLIDGTDVTVYFKFGVFAIKAKEYHRARGALEEGFRRSSLKHWPSLDLLVMLTYMLKDYMSALRYVALSLEYDPGYRKGLEIRQRISNELAVMHIDGFVTIPENQVITDFKYHFEPIKLPSGKKPKPPPYKVFPSSLTFESVGKELISLYNKITRTEDASNFLTPVKMPKVRLTKLSVSTPTEWEEIKDIGTGGPLNEATEICEALVEECLEQALIQPLGEYVDDILDSILDKIDYGRVTKSSLTGVRSFLKEVPLELMEKRRSCRVRDSSIFGADESTQDDITAFQLMDSFIPHSLQTTVPLDENESVQEKTAANRMVKASKDDVTLFRKEETKRISAFVEEDGGRSGANPLVYSFLQHLIATDHLKWPTQVVDVFYECYVRWRDSFQIPNDFDPIPTKHLKILTLGHECMMDRMARKLPVESIQEFIPDDFCYVRQNFYTYNEEWKQRTLALQLQYYYKRNMVTEFTNIGALFQRLPADSDIFVCCPNYKVWNLNEISRHLKASSFASLLDEVNILHDEGSYEKVVDALADIVEGGVPFPEGTDSSLPYCLLIDSYWNLEEYRKCVTWLDAGLNALVEELNDEEWKNLDAGTIRQVKNYLEMLDCCLEMLDGDLSWLKQSSRARLVQHVMKIVVFQLDNQSLSNPWSVLPWIVEYKLIYAEEKSVLKDPNLNYSVNFLCTTHDYLGPQSMCTSQEGRLLLIILDRLVPLVMEDPGNGNIFKKHLDQAVYCLYAHPSKKSKVKHLVDHGVSQVGLSWEKSVLLYTYLRPKVLPEFDDFKTSSISTEVEMFLKRVIALFPNPVNMEERKTKMKEYIMNLGQEDAKIPEFDDTELPPELKDLFFLLADYNFKNQDFAKAIDFFLVDTSFNPRRDNSWVMMSLAFASICEENISFSDMGESHYKHCDPVGNCFRKATELCPSDSTVFIESGNFYYHMHSLCSKRIKYEAELLTLSTFTKITKINENFLNEAKMSYRSANALMSVDDGSSDETWCMHYMLGKIMEKENKPLEECIEEYMKSLENLSVGHKVTIPRKISYNSPPDDTLEMLEVLYRIHTCVLKQEIKRDDEEKIYNLEKVVELLKEVRSKPLFPSGGIGKVIEESRKRYDNKILPDVIKVGPRSDGKDQLWKEVVLMCLEALEVIVMHFPQHFKALHLLGCFFLRSKACRDVKRAKALILDIPTKSFYVPLFQERKPTNLFNGIWRSPLTELDKPGSFESHMTKAVHLLIELAKSINEYKLLAEVAQQLKKTPDSDRKYLEDNERKKTAAYSFHCMVECLRAEGKKNDVEQVSKVLMDAYKMYLKMRKSWGKKEEEVRKVLLEIFGRILGRVGTFDELTFFINTQEMWKKQYAEYAAAIVQVAAQQDAAALLAAAVAAETAAASTAAAAPTAAMKSSPVKEKPKESSGLKFEYTKNLTLEKAQEKTESPPVRAPLASKDPFQYYAKTSTTSKSSEASTSKASKPSKPPSSVPSQSNKPTHLQTTKQNPLQTTKQPPLQITKQTSASTPSASDSASKFQQQFLASLEAASKKSSAGPSPKTQQWSASDIAKKLTSAVPVKQSPEPQKRAYPAPQQTQSLQQPSTLPSTSMKVEVIKQTNEKVLILDRSKPPSVVSKPYKPKITPQQRATPPQPRVTPTKQKNLSENAPLDFSKKSSTALPSANPVRTSYFTPKITTGSPQSVAQDLSKKSSGYISKPHSAASSSFVPKAGSSTAPPHLDAMSQLKKFRQSLTQKMQPAKRKKEEKKSDQPEIITLD